MSMEKYKALEHPYPATMDKIEKFGFDPKQLHHIFRLNEFIKRYVYGDLYKDCLISQRKEFLIEVKKGCHTLDEARTFAKFLTEETRRLKDKYMQENPIKINKEVEGIMNHVLIGIMKHNFITELNGEG